MIGIPYAVAHEDGTNKVTCPEGWLERDRDAT